MIKKFAALLTAFGYLALSPVYAYAATLAVIPSSGQINKGCDVTFTIELDTQGAQTDGTDVILTYDPTKMTIAQTDITNGKIYADYPGNSVDSTAGKVSISGIAQVSEAFSGKGTFASLKFKVNSAASGVTALNFDFDTNNKTNSTDTNVVERGTVSDVLSSVTNGNYTIGTGSCANGVGAPAASSLPISSPIASSTSLPTSLPAAGLLDNTVLVASVGMLLIVLGIIGIAAL